jgi:hypothetical protein
MTEDDQHRCKLALSMIKGEYRVENLHHKYSIRDKVFVVEADPRLSTTELYSGEYLLFFEQQVIGVYYFDGNRRAQLPSDKWIAIPIGYEHGVGIRAQWGDSKSFELRVPALVHLMEQANIGVPEAANEPA